jgi:ribosome-binding factor A
VSRRRDDDDGSDSRPGRDARRSSPGPGKKTGGRSSGRRRGGSGATRAGEGLLPASAEPAPRVPRRLRVAADLHQSLVVALSQLRDPRLASASVTQVEMTDDLQLARVHVRVGIGAEDGASQRKELMFGLRSAIGRLRKSVAQDLGLRYAPQLRFVYDEGLDAALRVDELLAEIREDDEER